MLTWMGSIRFFFFLPFLLVNFFVNLFIVVAFDFVLFKLVKFIKLNQVNDSILEFLFFYLFEIFVSFNIFLY
jgi:hypothetical protein